MIARFTLFALSARFVIVAASLALLVAGLYSFLTLDIEAYPDPVQPRVEISRSR
jgi:heavy metal efflux system protein